MELLVEKLTTTILVANVVEEFALSYGRFPPIQLINSLGNTKQWHTKYRVLFQPFLKQMQYYPKAFHDLNQHKECLKSYKNFYESLTSSVHVFRCYQNYNKKSFISLPNFDII